MKEISQVIEKKDDIKVLNFLYISLEGNKKIKDGFYLIFVPHLCIFTYLLFHIKKGEHCNNGEG